MLTLLRALGDSMYPSVVSHSFIFVSKLSISNICFGDLVVIHSPQEGNQHFIKRVIGTSTDEVILHGRDLIINRERVKRTQFGEYIIRGEKYITSRTSFHHKTFTTSVLASESIHIKPLVFKIPPPS